MQTVAPPGNQFDSPPNSSRGRLGTASIDATRHHAIRVRSAPVSLSLSPCAACPGRVRAEACPCARSALPDEPVVQAIRIRHELVVRASLYFLAPVEHDDLIAVTDGAQPMRDNQAAYSAAP